jgi:hypothetical protein
MGDPGLLNEALIKQPKTSQEAECLLYGRFAQHGNGSLVLRTIAHSDVSLDLSQGYFILLKSLIGSGC